MTTEPTRASRVRAYLAEHQPATRPQLREALDLTSVQIHTTLSDLMQAGFVTSSGTARQRSYTLTGKKPMALDATARAERNRLRMERRRRASGGLTRAERTEVQRAQARENRAEKARLAALDRAVAAVQRIREREARATARKAARREYERQRSVRRLAERRAARPSKPVGKPVFRAGRKLRAVERSSTIEHKPAPRMQTSSEWLAASVSHRIDVIAPGYVSPASQFKHLSNQPAAIAA